MITTLVGNYPKVAEGSYSTKLIGAITKWQRKEFTDAQLEETCQDITRSVIQEQEQAGLDLLTDGQIRWEDLVSPLAKRLEGFEINGLTRWFNNNVYYRRPILRHAPIRTGGILVDDYLFAKSCTGRPVKAVLPGPYTFATMSEDQHYKRLRPFVMKLAEILNEEAIALAKAGAPIVQFDEPSIGFGKTDIRLAIDALNVVSEGVTAKTALYTYFGALDGILPSLMRAKIDIIGVDIVSKPKNMAALKTTKITKELALGCMDARNTKLESVKELQAIFKTAKRLLPSDRLYINPNCGLEFLPHTQALAKVRRLTEAARSFKWN
jgi:5-methyltetrahydropteroyltriglutamate--homocysteine methyltransferase